jgi:drug/metabolite transporter superfamily protein YnfA
MHPNVAPLPYSDIVQHLQYLEMIGRIFSCDRDWIYHHTTRILEILPPPANVGSFTAAYGQQTVALVTIWSWAVDTRQLDPMDLDFFRRKMLIQAMLTLANIRTKFDSMGVVGGDRSMNGAELQANAETMQDKLEEDIKNWKRAVPIIQG